MARRRRVGTREQPLLVSLLKHPVAAHGLEGNARRDSVVDLGRSRVRNNRPTHVQFLKSQSPMNK